ncbi:MAG: alkaline phosphatase family protein, partial [Candidatus Dormibacteraeota bacterium]|nr:alkaline phosphatase family protein [Candidatus Dormibacteraeota bacterium]
MTRVVLLGLDGFPHRAITAGLTPRLWDLGLRGGRAGDGGITDLPSSTDPGFCSLLTGCRPSTHGVRTTSWRYARLPAWAGVETPRVPTIFDACRAAGIRSAAIVGDDRGLLCTGSAHVRWPPDGVIPPGTPLDAHGYPTNAAVRPHLMEALDQTSLGLVFGHLNEADTMGHDHGPESDAARACYHDTDGLVGEVLDALRGRWAETVVVVVSDHDMQSRNTSEPIDPMSNNTQGWW